MTDKIIRPAISIGEDLVELAQEMGDGHGAHALAVAIIVLTEIYSDSTKAAGRDPVRILVEASQRVKSASKSSTDLIKAVLHDVR